MKKRAAALALACMLAALPLSACQKNAVPPDEEIEFPLPEIVLPPDDEPPAQIPQEPASPEEPTLPEPEPEPEPVPPQEEPVLPEEPPAEEPPQEEPPAPPQEEPKPAMAEYLLVNTSGLNIRTGAGTQYTSLGAADKGALLILSGRTGKWYETRYKGRTAFVHSDYVSVYRMPKSSSAIEEVIKAGFDYLGVKYVFGAVRYHDGNGKKLSGFTTSAFDCSSYMQYIFLKGAGVYLNMTTRTQVKQGKAATGELKRGDLMFFTNASRVNNTGIERVGHVALYLGNNYILHTASDYARAEQITSARWNYYLTARRML